KHKNKYWDLKMKTSLHCRRLGTRHSRRLRHIHCAGAGLLSAGPTIAPPMAPQALNSIVGSALEACGENWLGFPFELVCGFCGGSNFLSWPGASFVPCRTIISVA